MLKKHICQILNRISSKCFNETQKKKDFVSVSDKMQEENKIGKFPI